MEGCIFDIKRFAIHDGPGIRTTVFLKGCPLRCVWCHNPEGLSFAKDIWVKDERCIRCGSCVAECDSGALSMNKKGVTIDRSRCTFCNKCLTLCPTCAIHRIDRMIQAKDLAIELERDKLFADISGGGITLSGGEPLAQIEFTMELLKEIQLLGIRTCMESSLAVPLDSVADVLPYLDDLIVDLKLINNEEHQRYTRMGNRQIFENFRYLADNCNNLLVRIPLIPGITDTDANLIGIARFVEECNASIPIELINYNPLAPNKYRFLGQQYDNQTACAFSEQEMAQFNRIIQQARRGDTYAV